MKIGSVIAIYFLFFAFSAFALLPFGVRTSDEAGEAKVPGQADSAPHRFDLQRHLLRSVLLALGLFGLYYANWHFNWLSTDDLDFWN